MTAYELVSLPDAVRVREVAAAETPLLQEALDLAKWRGSAAAAADIAFELGRRAG